MKILLSMLLLFVALSSPSARAVTIRYSIVVGNNQGTDSNGDQPFDKLFHAEREAKILNKRLLEFGNFDPTRTILLLGGTRKDLFQAVQSIVDKKKSDFLEFGEADTLFAFFFTGHGLKGQLLLDDGPLQALELGELFQKVKADFNVGVFDACFSGSLDEAVLSQKGIRSTPGLNIFKELPKEILTAEGSIWFVSSGPTQMSYEDRQLGGVFTHFFIEALKEGHAEGPGITLENIWHYARNKTVSYTSLRGKHQVPQQFVASLKSTGPMYFSFPTNRNATLTLAAKVKGRFVLTYADGQFTEIIEKTEGNPMHLSVYPGPVKLMRIKDGTVQAQKSINLSPDTPAYVFSEMDSPLHNRIGEAHHTLWEKGFGSQLLAATQRIPRWSVLLGVGYGYNFKTTDTLSAGQLALVSLQLDRSLVHLGLLLGYGNHAASFQSFSYHADSLATGIKAGAGFNIGKLRLTLSGGVLGEVNWQRFDDSEMQTKWMIQPTAWISAKYPFGEMFGNFPVLEDLLAEISLFAGPAYLPGVGKITSHTWRFQGGLNLALYYQIR